MHGQDTSDVRLDRAPAPSRDVVVLDLAGELDMVVSARLRSLIQEAIAERPRLLVVDMADVGFVDSTILRELLRAREAMEAAGGRIVVAGVQPAVRRLFELTETTSVFNLAESRAVALGEDG